MTDEELLRLKTLATKANPFPQDGEPQTWEGMSPDNRMRSGYNNELFEAAREAIPDIVDELIELRKEKAANLTICQCGHFAKDHALENGHSHKSTRTETGACGCVFNKEEALTHAITDKTIYNTFSTLLLGTSDSIVDSIKASPFEDISPSDIEIILFNGKVEQCANCGSWMDLNNGYTRCKYANRRL